MFSRNLERGKEVKMTAYTDTEKIGPLQWKALLGALAGWVLDAMDWMFLALALPLIMKEWGLSLGEAGALGGAALIGVGISAIFAGSIADLIGRTKALMITMMGYSVLTALCGFTQNFTQLFILRIITGLFLGGEWGIGAVLLNEYWPPRRRAQAMSTVQSGWAIGFGIAAAISTVVLAAYGWRALFFIGIFPAFVAVWIRYTVPEPPVWVKSSEERKKLLERKAKGEILKDEEASKTAFPLKSLFEPGLIKLTIMATVMCLGVVMAFWGGYTWLPTYLATVKKLSIVKAGIFLIWLNVGALVGYQVFGYLGDKYGRRFSFGLGTLLSSIATVIYVSLDTPEAVLYFGPIYGFITMGFYGLFGVVISELFPAYCRSTAANFAMNFARGLSFFGPYIIGTFAAKYGLAAGIGLTGAFYLVSFFTIIAMPDPRKVEASRNVRIAA